MNIFLYWNRIDSDSKSIYKFLKDQDFRDTISQNHSLTILEPYSRFSLTKTIQAQIAQSDLALFFTHGEEDVILKSKNQCSFIDPKNAQLLSNKRVIAICCSSAKQLGPLCVDSPVYSKF